MMLVVVKIGSSSVTSGDGAVNRAAIAKLAGEVSRAMAEGAQVIVVTSGAIAAGLHPIYSRERPSDMVTLQAIAAVGQPKLMRVYAECLESHGHQAAQVLLAPTDFSDRRQYLHARQTINRLLELGAVPVVNENDTIADDEIRFGDNDRLAALVAHMLHAELLVLLTDTAGLFTADPRFDNRASLVEEVAEIDFELEKAAGGPGTDAGSGGMASKLAAAKIAQWSGVRTVIADATRQGVIAGAIRGEQGIGTVVQARDRRLASRKVWIAFAVAPMGTITVDAGARDALEGRGTSLLPAGVVSVAGEFSPGDVVEVVDPAGAVFAKGVVRHTATSLNDIAGRKTFELPPDMPHEVIHRDDLVLLRV